MRLSQLLATAALLGAGTAQAATVAESLPYPTTPDWTKYSYAPETMVLADGSTTMTTRPYDGVWFGWGTSYGNQPSWSLGTSGEGNQLSLSASFSADAADWQAYVRDGSYEAVITFNPTPCHNQVCYGMTPASGVNIFFADADNPGAQTGQFIALDTTQQHSYEFLLKNGAASYRIDGQVYSGAARQTSDSRLLVIGDGSGGDPTGVGSMTVYGVVLDNAPAADALTPVPEPGEWAMMMAGLGLVGAITRRRKR